MRRACRTRVCPSSTTPRGLEQTREIGGGDESVDDLRDGQPQVEVVHRLRQRGEEVRARAVVRDPQDEDLIGADPLVVEDLGGVSR